MTKPILCKTCKYCIAGRCEHKNNLVILVKGRKEIGFDYKEKANKVKCDVWAKS